jgi:hypothetical protein
VSIQTLPPPADESPGDDAVGGREYRPVDRDRAGRAPVPEAEPNRRPDSAGDTCAEGLNLDEGEVTALIREVWQARTAHGDRAGAREETATAPGGTPHPALARGTRLEGGELCILEALDAGGMGEVYLAWHETLNDEVVIKVSQAPAMEARFRHEIELQNKLGAHPQIVAAKTAGRSDGRYYLMMEYVPGVDLERYVRDHGPLPWREACAYARQAALGLAHAHHRGVVHRDLKPRNLIRSEVDGSIKILDWGLARRLDRASAEEDARLTPPSSILGTPDYIAPEQIDDPATVGPSSDLYSLGCTLYELLTGCPPYHASPNKLMAHLEAPIPALPSELGVPRGVERMLRRLLAKRVRDRHGSAQEFVDALDAAVAAEESGRPQPRVWRGAGLAAGLIGAVAILVVIAIDRRPGRGTGAPARPAQLDPGPVIQPLNRTASDPLPLTGELTVRVWTPGSGGKRGWKIEEPGTLPVLPGEWVHLEARLNRPAYAYLLWLDGQGRVASLYPWSDRKFESRPVGEVALVEVHSPAELSKGWELKGPSGLETALLLVRRTPLPPDTDLAGPIGRLPSSPLHDPQERAVFFFNSGQQPVEAIDRGAHRGLGEEAKQIDDPLLQLLDRLRPHFELARAVRFAYRGE